MKGSIKIIGDIISPATDEDEWEVLRDDPRITVDDPEILRIIGEESKEHGTDKLTTKDIGRVVRSARTRKSKR